MSDDTKAARLQAILDAQGVKPVKSEAFDALAMPADTKAAPSLADDFALLLLATTKKDTRMIAWCVNNAARILAALRAVETLRKIHWKFKVVNHFRCIYCDEKWPCPTIEALDGVEAVQALLGGME